MSERTPPSSRADYGCWSSIDTRWMDNDVYGHVNNVVYYAYFDTVVNRHLIEHGFLNLERSDVIGLVAETGCRYFAPLAFPERIDAGLRVDHVGRSSVRYAVGLFSEGAETAAADGHFVHVYVDRASRRPVQLPPQLLEIVQALGSD